METVDIYRGIGNVLRGLGASRIYLLKSKTVSRGSDFTLLIEVIADQVSDYGKARKMLAKAFQNVECTLIDDKNPDYFDLLQEAEEDGIQL